MWTFELQLRLISVFLSTFAISLLSPRFSKALCHLTHYSTDTHPPPPLPLWSHLLYRRPARAMQVNVLIEASEWLSLVCMYMDVLLCHKIQGLIFMPFFFFFFFNSKGKVYIALCCTGQCPKVNKFLIKYTWLVSQPHVTWKTALFWVFLESSYLFLVHKKGTRNSCVVEIGWMSVCVCVFMLSRAVCWILLALSLCAHTQRLLAARQIGRAACANTAAYWEAALRTQCERQTCCINSSPFSAVVARNKP